MIILSNMITATAQAQPLSYIIIGYWLFQAVLIGSARESFLPTLVGQGVQTLFQKRSLQKPMGQGFQGASSIMPLNLP